MIKENTEAEEVGAPVEPSQVESSKVRRSWVGTGLALISSGIFGCIHDLSTFPDGTYGVSLG